MPSTMSVGTTILRTGGLPYVAIENAQVERGSGCEVHPSVALERREAVLHQQEHHGRAAAL